MSVRVVCMPGPGKPEAAYSAVHLVTLGISSETVTADAGFCPSRLPLCGFGPYEVSL